MTEIEPINDAYFDRHGAIDAHGNDVLTRREYQGMRATLRRLEAQLAALQARAIPEPRRIETIEEINDLPDGAYWVALDRMRDTSLPWCLLLRIYGAWVWHGDDIHEADSDLIGAWIVGPLPLPATPIGETDNVG